MLAKDGWRQEVERELAMSLVEAVKDDAALPAFYEKAEFVMESIHTSLGVEPTVLLLRGLRCSPSLDNITRKGLLSTGILRLVDMIANSAREGGGEGSAQSIQHICSAVGLPGEVVDVRHKIIHKELPSLDTLVRVSSTALEFLTVTFWEPRVHAKPRLAEWTSKTRNVDTNTHVNANTDVLSENEQVEAQQVKGQPVTGLDAAIGDRMDVQTHPQAVSTQELMAALRSVQMEVQKAGQLSPLKKALGQTLSSKHTFTHGTDQDMVQLLTTGEGRAWLRRFQSQSGVVLKEAAAVIAAALLTHRQRDTVARVFYEIFFILRPVCTTETERHEEETGKNEKETRRHEKETGRHEKETGRHEKETGRHEKHKGKETERLETCLVARYFVLLLLMHLGENGTERLITDMCAIVRELSGNDPASLAIRLQRAASTLRWLVYVLDDGNRTKTREEQEVSQRKERLMSMMNPTLNVSKNLAIILHHARLAALNMFSVFTDLYVDMKMTPAAFVPLKESQLPSPVTTINSASTRASHKIEPRDIGTGDMETGDMETGDMETGDMETGDLEETKEDIYISSDVTVCIGLIHNVIALLRNRCI